MSFRVCAILFSVICVSACGSSTSPSSTPEPAPAGSTTITMVSGASVLTNTAYNPNPVTVSVGTTVSWLNNDSTTHTSVANNGASLHLAERRAEQPLQFHVHDRRHVPVSLHDSPEHGRHDHRSVEVATKTQRHRVCVSVAVLPDELEQAIEVERLLQALDGPGLGAAYGIERGKHDDGHVGERGLARAARA